MAKSTKKDGTLRKNATKGKMMIALRMDASLKRDVDIAAWIKRKTFSAFVEEAAAYYLKSFPLTQLEKDLIQKVLNEQSNAKAREPGSLYDVILQSTKRKPLALTDQKIIDNLKPGKKNTLQEKAKIAYKVIAEVKAKRKDSYVIPALKKK